MHPNAIALSDQERAGIHMQKGILHQVAVAKAHLGISFFTVLGGGFPCVSGYVITHCALPDLWRSTDQIDRFRFYALLPVVAACLAYSVRTVSQWGLDSFGDKWKTNFLIVALEGVMVFAPIPPLALGALAILVAINAVATTSKLMDETQGPAESEQVGEAVEPLSLAAGATQPIADDGTQSPSLAEREGTLLPPSDPLEPPPARERVRPRAVQAGPSERVRWGKQRDGLYLRAVELVEEAGKCHTSALQRQLGVGYNSAAKLVERMELDGLVGPAGAGGRQVLRCRPAPPSGGNGHRMHGEPT